MPEPRPSPMFWLGRGTLYTGKKTPNVMSEAGIIAAGLSFPEGLVYWKRTPSYGGSWVTLRSPRRSASPSGTLHRQAVGSSFYRRRPDGVLATQGFVRLPISFAHGKAAGALPDPHRDPSHGMLMAEATLDHLVLVSNGQQCDSYGVRRLW